MHLPFEATHLQLQRNILIATVDTEVRKKLTEVLEALSLNGIWVKTVEEIRTALQRGNITACLSGFWLVDGTYRDVVRCVKRQAARIPLVVLCPPSCSQEQNEFFGALNIGAFGFICYPYQGQDLKKVLSANMESHVDGISVPAPSEGPLHSAFAPALRRAT